MNSKSFMVSVFGKLLMLAMMFCLAGCQPTLMTRTVGTSPLSTIPLTSGTMDSMLEDLCEHAWKPQTYSSRDTEQTQLEARANNAARAKYCDG